MAKIKTIFYYNLFYLLFSYNALAGVNLVLDTQYFNKNYYLNISNDYKISSYTTQDIKITSDRFATKYIDWDRYNIPSSKPVTDDNKPDMQYGESEHNWWTAAWGKPFSDTAYLGMWTRHYQQRKNHIKNNKLIALCYKGYYLGTFINSHGDRTVSIGIQRRLYNDSFSIFEIEAGYRAGIMYGYKRYLRLWGTSFFPLVQLIADISLGNFVAEVSWAWMVFTIGFGYKF